MKDLSGTVLLNRYQLQAELGRSGMVTVYRTHDSVLEGDVAVWSCYQESPVEFRSHSHYDPYLNLSEPCKNPLTISGRTDKLMNEP